MSSFFGKQASPSPSTGVPGSAPAAGSVLGPRRASGPTKISKWAPVCIPTMIPGFDALIHGKEGPDGKLTGGLPLASPGLTCLAGGPGAGKSKIAENMAAWHLSAEDPIIWFTLEKPVNEVAWNIEHIAGKLDLKLPREDLNPDEHIIKGFECHDYYSTGIDNKGAIDIANQIVAWRKANPNGRIVIIDSITELTAYEMHLREVLKKLITNMSRVFVPAKLDVAILMTSQYRGVGQDGGLAGGLAIGHRSNAVIQVEAIYASNFDKRYLGVERGTQVRKIWVEKTASFAHDIAEHFLNISEDGIVTVSEESIAGYSELKCPTCGKPVDTDGPHMIDYKGNVKVVYHADCAPQKTQGKKSLLS